MEEEKRARKARENAEKQRKKAEEERARREVNLRGNTTSALRPPTTGDPGGRLANVQNVPVVVTPMTTQNTTQVANTQNRSTVTWTSAAQGDNLVAPEYKYIPYAIELR